jgi:ribokinase
LGFSQVPGGKGANQAVAAAKLGAAVPLFGLVGDDPFGDKLIDELKGDGVDTSFMERRQGSSGLALIQVDHSGENQIVIIPGANGKVDENYAEKSLDAIMEAEVLLLQLEIPFETTAYLLKQLKLAGSDGPQVVLDPAPARDLSSLPLSAVDFIIPNENELKQLTSDGGSTEIRKKILKKGVGAVIETRGGKGSVYFSENEQIEVAGFPVDVSDTTAAGDAFAGALAVGLAEKMEIKEILRFANATGAISATRAGAQPSLADREEVEVFLAKHSSK